MHIFAYAGAAILTGWNCLLNLGKWREGSTQDPKVCACYIEIDESKGKPALNRHAVFQSKLEEAVVTVQIQLGRYVGTMGVNSPLADEQFRSDFPAGLFLSDEFEDAPLGFCQIVQAGLLRSELLGTTASA